MSWRLPLVVRAALVGTRWWVRYYAVVSLWRLGGERALAAIGRSVYDPDELVAEVAERALAGELREWDRPSAEGKGIGGVAKGVTFFSRAGGIPACGVELCEVISRRSQPRLERGPTEQTIWH